MIGMFGTPAGRSLSSNTNAINTATKMKSKATNALLDNQIHDKIKETNNNLIKKRPNFLKFFNDNFMKSSTDDTSSESTCKRFVIIFFNLYLFLTFSSTSTLLQSFI